jgi:hypothetical protein
MYNVHSLIGPTLHVNVLYVYLAIMSLCMLALEGAYMYVIFQSDDHYYRVTVGIASFMYMYM